MNLRDLHYLVALAKHAHFGKAAAVCFVSQPTLSMQIKKLECELNVSLLERGNKVVLLTEVGRKIVAHAQEILRQARQIHDIAKSAEDPYAGELKLGIIPTLAPYFLPSIILPLQEAFPKLVLSLYEEQTKQIVSKLHQGTLDSGILALPVTEPELTSIHLFDEQFLLAVPKAHSLARKKKLKQSELTGEKLLLLEEGHCLRDQALALCHAAQVQENQSFRATSLETLRHMVAAGMGITLMPQLASKTNDNLTYVTFAEPKPMRTMGLVWRNSSVKSTLLISVAELIRKEIVQGLSYTFE